MKNQKVKALTHVALMVAFLSVSSQIAIPTAFSVPLTLQIFSVALIGYIFPFKKSLLSALIYVVIGAIGIPVFANFQGGLFHLFSYTGGFIWGFFPLVILCSLSSSRLKIPFGILGVFACHLIGVLQYSLVSRVSLWMSLLTMSLPYIIKDLVLLLLAYVCAKAINSRIKTK